MEIEDTKLLSRKNGNRTLNKRTKIFFVAALFIAFIIYRFTYLQPALVCINDAYHDFTLNTNRKIVESAGPGF